MIASSNGHIPPFPVYLFDIDGTLVDSAVDICGAVRSVLADTPRSDCTFEFLKSYIGRHLYDLFRDLDFPEDSLDELLVRYRRIYADRKHNMTKVYPGVIEALSALPGRKSSATTKNSSTTRLVLEKFGLLPFFDHVQGTDGFPAKPEPHVIFKALETLGAKPEECLFVGDSAADMEAGRRAGVKIAAVTYGYGQRADLARWSPDYWIGDLRQLIAASACAL